MFLAVLNICLIALGYREFKECGKGLRKLTWKLKDSYHLWRLQVNVLRSFCSKTLDMTGMSSKEVSQAAAGISISLDKIVSVLQDENHAPAMDVVVCSVGHRSMVKEKAAVIQELWAAGIKSSLMDSLQVRCGSGQLTLSLRTCHGFSLWGLFILLGL
jgi:hypothetical protein